MFVRWVEPTCDVRCHFRCVDRHANLLMRTPHRIAIIYIINVFLYVAKKDWPSGVLYNDKNMYNIQFRGEIDLSLKYWNTFMLEWTLLDKGIEVVVLQPKTLIVSS